MKESSQAKDKIGNHANPTKSTSYNSINGDQIDLKAYSNGIRISSFFEDINPRGTNRFNNESYFKTIRSIKPHFLMALVDPVIPILLLITSISCTSIMGMIIILLLCVHIITCNNVKKSFGPLKICLILNILVDLLVIIFTIIDLSNAWKASIDLTIFRILGLNFHNNIVNTPILPLVSSLISISCQIFSFVLIPKTSIIDFTHLRSKFCKANSFQYMIEFLWEICNAFNLASNLSFFTLPLLIYIAISVSSISISGVNFMPRIIIKIFMGYSILYSLFEAYMLSFVGEKYNCKSLIRYNYIGPKNSVAANYVCAVLFSYFSCHHLSASEVTLNIRKRIPRIFIIISNAFILALLFLTFLFGLYYPNYLSLLWIIVPVFSSFCSLHAINKFFMPMMTFIFIISFMVQILTNFGIIKQPTFDGTDYFIEFYELFGLFRYKNDFTFSCCGFYMICLYSIVSRITHSKIQSKNKSKKNRLIKSIDLQNSINFFFNMLIKYFSAFCVFVIGITFSFFENRFGYILFGLALFVIISFALYSRFSFIIIKLFICIFFFGASYFKITINDVCLDALTNCLSVGHFHDMMNSGIVAPIDMTLPQFLWPMIVLFVLCSFLLSVDSVLSVKIDSTQIEEEENIDNDYKYSFWLNKKKKDLFLHKIPHQFVCMLHFLIGFLNLLHFFLYETDIFSLFFTLAGISVLAALYTQKKKHIINSCCFSSLVSSLSLVFYYLSHFDGPRNLISSIIPLHVLNISTMKKPAFDISIVAAILFLTTISFYSQSTKGREFPFAYFIFYEIRRFLHYFDFYLSWFFIFLFSIANNSPSVIKFVLMVFFGFGQLSIPLFRRIRVPFLIFNILYLSIQLCCSVFDLDNPKHKYFAILKFVGFFWSTNGNPTKSERNTSIISQILCIFLGILCSKPFQEQERKEEFERLLTTKLYRAIVSLLHYFLPVFVLGSLCYSTMYNQTVFGWFTFTMTVLLTYNPHILNNRSQLITFIFNLLFVLYYLLYLGFPSDVFNVSVNLLKNIPEKNLDVAKDWLRYLGVYNISTRSLVANSIAAFVFTIFLHFNRFEVDYKQSFLRLPNFLREILKLLTTFVFEIFITVLIIISTNIHTVLGLFYFLFTSVLFTLTLLHHYDHVRTLRYLSYATFWVISAHLLSRMTIFTENDMGYYIKLAFDVHFQGTSQYGQYWTVIYILERILIQIMNSDFYHQSRKEVTHRHAFRYIRSRQLKIIRHLDQQILKNKDELINQRVKNLNQSTFDAMLKTLLNDSNQSLNYKQSNIAQGNIQGEEDNNEEEEESIKLSEIGYWFAEKFIRLCANAFTPNCEAGLNIYTLKSLIEVLKRDLAGYDAKKRHVYNEKDYQFLKQLPPTFSLQFQSIADALSFKLYEANRTFDFVVRYLLMFLRRIAFFLVFIAILVYIFTKPYLYGLFAISLFLIFFCGFDLSNRPNKFRIYMIFLIFVVAMNQLSKMGLVYDHIIQHSNSLNIKRLSISPFDLFGLNSASSSFPEIFLLVTFIFYIVDQRAWCEVFPADYYLNKFEKELTGFPEDFSCEDETDRESIITTLGLSVHDQPLLYQIRKQVYNRGVISTSILFITTILDTFSLLLLILFWTSWTQQGLAKMVLDGSSAIDSFRLDVLFIFVLIIHVMFMIAVYYCQISNLLFPMLVLTSIWLCYIYCISFFYIPSVNREYRTNSLFLYVFVRILAALLTYYRIATGKFVVEYQFPSFQKDWRRIILANRFVLFCPFVFEIQSVMIWMSRDTYVDFMNFMMIRDFGMRLEIMISSQVDPAYYEHPVKQRNRLVGSCILLVLLVLLFGPLFFMTDVSSAITTNLPLSASLTIGLTPFQPLYQAYATIAPITSRQLQEISDLSLSSLNIMVLNSNKDTSLLTFPTNPSSYWFPSDDDLSNTVNRADSYFSQFSGEICPYYELTVKFTSATTISNSQAVTMYYQDKCLQTSQEKEEIRQIFSKTEIGPVVSFPDFPVAWLVPTSDSFSAAEDLKREINLSLFSRDFDHLHMDLGNDKDRLKLSFLINDSLVFLLYSQPVSTKNLFGSLMSENGGIVGVYFLIIVTFGVVLRNAATSQLDGLWISNMERPEKLYRLIAAIYAFRAANDCENELNTTNNLLLLLRSKETCIKLTCNTDHKEET